MLRFLLNSRWLKNQSGTEVNKRAAKVLLALEIFLLVAKALGYLVLVVGLFILSYYLSSKTTTTITAELNTNSQQITGTIEQTGLGSEVFGAIVAFVLAFFAGSIIVEPFRHALSTLKDPKPHAFWNIAQRMPNAIDKSFEGEAHTTVFAEWNRIPNTIRDGTENAERFDALAKFVVVLQDNF